MRQSHNSHRLIPLLLAGAALAACDQRTPDLPTGTRAEVGQAGVAPLLAAGPEAIPGRYVVVMQDGQAGTADAVARDVVAAHGGKVYHVYGTALNGFAATLTPAAVDALRRNPQVQYVAEDAMAYPVQTIQPGATWGLDRIDQRALPLSTTYTYSRTGAGVRVYVMDTGIRTTHAEFGTRASVGIDFVGDGQNGQDCNGHGTHVAGTIAGTTYGVAKAARVISVRVFGCTGGAEWSRIIAAVDWVTANAVKPAVVNMSLGGGYYAPVNTAVTNSITSGVVYAVAAGNSSYDACSYSPASTPTAVTVGSTASNDARSYFSNYGTCVDLFAPGSDITSAWYTSNTATYTISGTSMATPHTAGVAALYLQGSPTATPAVVAAALVATSTANRVTDPGTGSPNRLLFSRLTAPPPGATIGLSPSTLSFTFVRPVPNAAGAAPPPANAPRQEFLAVSGRPPKQNVPAAAAGEEATTSSTLSSRVTLSNTGTSALNWTATSNRSWLSMDPGSGQLNHTYTALLSATASSGGLAAGTHTGTLTVADPLATNSPGVVNVTVNVVEPVMLLVGTPRTGLSGASGSLRYFAVQVPTGATSLRIATAGGTGDADLYVRYGQIPSTGQYDCASAGGTNEDSCQVASPLPGTYYVMIRGYSTYSGATLSATSGGTPAAPLNLAARPTSTSAIQLTWADGSVNETGFSVARRSMSSTGAWNPWVVVGSPAANATRFTNTGLVAGTNYQYRLRSCNAAGCSPWVIGTALRIPTAAPSPPFGLVATAASGTAASLTWTDGSSDETSFTLTRALRNTNGTWGAYATVASPAANTTSFSNTGLLAGRQYRYQLRACNPAGCSAWVTSSAVLMPSVPTAPPAATAAKIAANTIRVQWTDGSSNETSFSVERASVSGGGVVGAFGPVATLAPNQVLYNNAGLALGIYRYRVRACNAAGCSAWRNTANVTLP